DILKGKSLKFRFSDNSLKIPHMGWNTINLRQNHFILKDYHKDSHLYFVHSYYPLPDETSDIFGESEHGITFPCAIGRNNLFATQFHPEKSGAPGLQMLKNFSEWEGDNAC
ncbi:MAG: glutamine amidotransferase-related protein, partial [Chitinivibrionales bacterium]